MPRMLMGGRRSAMPRAYTAAKAPWRGVGMDSWDFADLATTTESWWYDWDHLGGARNPANASLYVPMVYGDPAVTGQGGGSIATIGAGASTLLGFNEPDNAGTGGTNVTVARALALWPDLMATGARLGSPAVSADPVTSLPWLADFMAGVASNGYRVDFICCHWYGTVIADLLAYLTNLHDLYDRPVWLTETDAWTSSTTPSAATNATYATAMLAALKDVTWVERIAWFSNRPYTAIPGYANTHLVDATGALTTVGSAWIAGGNAIQWASGSSTVSAWAPAAVSGNAKIVGLVDAFTAATIDDRTFQYHAFADIDTGRLRLSGRSDFGAYAVATAEWDLTSSQIHFDAGTRSGATTDMLLLVLRQRTNTANRIEIYQWQTNIALNGLASGSSVAFSQTAFDATNHRWWRVRHDGTNVNLDTSANGSSWNNATLSFAASTLGWPLTAVEVVFNAGYTGTETTPRYSYIDSVNS